MGKMTASLQGPERAKTIDALVTPALLVDRGRLERNVQCLAEHPKKLGVVLRRKIKMRWQ
jgi:D-serine deaminase-like pyridoxal phosphate-dependent protein